MLETLADMLDRTLTPPGGADLAAGKEILLDSLDTVRAEIAARFKHSPSDEGKR